MKTLSASARLDASTEAALLQAAQSGDAAASGAIVRAILPFVASEARRYSGAVPHLREDLEAAGMEAVVHAIASFDPTRGVRFITHAKFAIREAMSSEKMTAAPASLNVPGRTLRRYEKAFRDAEKALASSTEDVTEARLVEAAKAFAVEAGMDPATFEAVHFAQSGGSLHATASFNLNHHGASDETSHGAERDVHPHLGETSPFLGTSSSRDPYAEADARDRVSRLMHVLDERARRIVALAYLSEEPMSDAAIAKVLGVVPSTVTRARNAALRKMAAA